MPVPNTKENMDKCICKDCPSYNQCMSDGREGLFCAVGKSKCEIKKENCICEDCPIDDEYRLTINLDLMERTILHLNNYYCIEGPAK